MGDTGRFPPELVAGQEEFAREGIVFGEQLEQESDRGRR
jgi:hypothetical protein